MQNNSPNITAKTNKVNWLKRLFTSEKYLPVIAAVAAGTYPIFFYFSNNYTLINSWGHVAYFAFMFIFIPVVVFLIMDRISRVKYLSKIRKFVLPFLNISVFLVLLKVCLYAEVQVK